MKYYFDIREIFSTTIAIEADSYEQAHQRVNAAYRRSELEFDYEFPDSMEITSIEEKDIFTEEKFDTLNCNDVVYDEADDGYSCPVCDKYIGRKWEIKDMDYPMPSYCSNCGTKLHY